jgi:AraC-like DNA-binding protein
VAQLPLDDRPLRLSWSDAVAGAELYVGEDVRAFASDWHFHEGWQLVAVTKGERRYESKSGVIIAKPGQLALLPPRLVHRAHCLEGGLTSFRIVTLPGDFGDLTTPGIPMVSHSSKHVDVFTSIFESLKAFRKYGMTAADTSGLQTIVRESSPISTLRMSAAPTFIFQVEAYLLKALDRIPSLDALSSLAGVSRYHLSHVFTRHIGLSPLAFHTRVRLMRARKLIADGLSLADASFLLNFSDQSHFGRQFKMVYGMTPGEYRQCLETALSSQVASPF